MGETPSVQEIGSVPFDQRIGWRVGEPFSVFFFSVLIIKESVEGNVVAVGERTQKDMFFVRRLKETMGIKLKTAWNKFCFLRIKDFFMGH